MIIEGELKRRGSWRELAVKVESGIENKEKPRE